MPKGVGGYPRRPVARQSTFPTGDPRRLRMHTATVAAPIPVLPTVTTVSAIAADDTRAHVTGAVNPNGLSTVWWIVYGTSLPLSGRTGGDPGGGGGGGGGPFPPGTLYPLGTLYPEVSLFPSGPTADQQASPNTSEESVGNGTDAVTVTVTLTGLSPGVTYYVAIVARSAAGTVYGNTLQVVAETKPVTPSTTVVPFGQPSATIPHFDAPFALTKVGAIVVEQDTLEEVLANVNVVVDCVVGECPQLPSFGRPDLTFAQEPVRTDDLVFAIQQLEPRASEDVLSQLAADGVNWNITLSTSTTGAQGI